MNHLTDIFSNVFKNISIYNLVALDIIEGIDGKFYVVDVNGMIGLEPLILFPNEFNQSIHEILNQEFYFDCSDFFHDFEKLQVGNGCLTSKIWIRNDDFPYEDKLTWRSKFNLPSPKINDQITLHKNPDYPKFLIKPRFGSLSLDIQLFNNEQFPVTQNSDFFVEEFIPSKLIEDYCYNIRVLMIVNDTEQHPVLYVKKKCPKPIIKNLPKGELTFDDSLSYISNRKSINNRYELIDDGNLREFVSKIRITP